MNLSAEALADIEDGLIQCLMNQKTWKSTVDQIVSATRSRGAGALPFYGRVPGIPVSTGCEEAFFQYFRDGWAENDFRMTGIPLALRSGILVDQNICDRNFMESSPFYNRFLESHGLKWFAGLVIKLGDEAWGFTLQRSPEQGPFTEAEQENLFGLLAVLQRTARLAGSLSETRHQGIVGTLDILRTPAVLLNRAGRVLHLSEKALALVGRDIDISKGSVRIRNNAGASKQLELHIRAAIWADIFSDHTALDAVIVDRPGKRPLIIRAQTLRKSGLDYFDGARVLVTFEDLEVKKYPDGTVLQKLYGLTPREIAICHHLYDGRTIKEISVGLTINIETIRTHVKNILGKTGMRRQGELLLMLGSILSPSSHFTA